jgi:4-hydroxy-3-polyprenylbenzoate decarboxylase
MFSAQRRFAKRVFKPKKWTSPRLNVNQSVTDDRMLRQRTLAAASHHRLADFLEELGRAGDLMRIAAEVDPQLEVAAVTARVASAGGPALLFERVKGHDLPVLTNLWGTQARICRALDVGSLDVLVDRLDAATKAGRDGGWLAKLTGGPRAEGGASSASVQVVKSGVCQQVVRLASDVDLAQLPALQSWPLERQAAITAGQVFTRLPDSSASCVASYPLVVLGAKQLGLFWHEYTAGHAHYEAFRARGERMPVAIALGGDPALACLAAATLPASTDALTLAALLHSRSWELVKCRTHDLAVPADADIIIEGAIDTAERPVAVGPLAGACGHYLSPRDVPRVHVTAITHRTNPVFVAMVHGPPPHETSELVKVTERLLLPHVRAVVPELVDLSLPGRAGLHNFAFLSIRKSHAQHAHKVASAVWGMTDLMHTKVVIVVDESVDVHCREQVMRAVGANVHPMRDVFFHCGPAHPLDHTAPSMHSGYSPAGSTIGGSVIGGSALGIDATAKLPQEHPYPWPAATRQSQEIVDLLERRWADYGLPHVGSASERRR